ncbi:tlde1 domain-containing protein [Rosenbergiella metrosideri]|uniref:tlde1 domain-containing protein n=1 Tax=Rosenbergiella metrosideri TaxID=2921185 RepID=UPI001F4F609A|nr:tlde1 domain-containing protein [Rosenbergiella metrosideri]
MTWIFEQSTGKLSKNGHFIIKGYSGKGPGKFNPDMEKKPNIRPLPRGKYQIIGRPFHHSHTGAYSIRLQPDPTNNVYGRAGFLIHGDSSKHPGEASNGCIILPLNVRQKIWDSGDKQIEVVP